jgi:hypothetical protein
MSVHPWDVEAATDAALSEEPEILLGHALLLPDLLMKWGIRYAEARRAAAIIEQDAELAEAQAFLRARMMTRPDGKLYTIEDAKASAIVDPDYQAARVAKSHADLACVRAKTTIDALVKKADMIREIGANQRADTRV